MKLLFILIAIPLCLSTPGQRAFEKFLNLYGKSYEGLEYQKRFQIFLSNMQEARRLTKETTAFHGITQFMDLTPEEFKAQYLMAPMPTAGLAEACLRKGVYYEKTGVQIPDTWDWRQTPNIVTDVKNQASCGSCWAFSTAGNIESVNAIVKKVPAVSLSPQFSVDCSKGCSSEMVNGRNTTVCNQGCSGGWPWTAMYDIIAQGGMPGWTDYPYVGINQACKGNNNAKTLVKLSSYTCVGMDKTDNEDEIAECLYTHGPLSVCLNADYFQTYRGGILDPPNCDKIHLDHCITLVGYGVENNKPYWICKNSWAATWGEQGYVRIAKGKGCCGINEAVSLGNVL
jgi:cathepsin F